MLDINLCSIKLHELCEFHQNKNICRITLISLFVKLNILNCFPSADITLQECSQDNNTVSITTCQFGSKCRREEILYLSGHGEGGSGFIQITILNFTSRLLFDLLFTYRLKDIYHLFFFTNVFSLFRFIKRFFNSVSSS